MSSSELTPDEAANQRWWDAQAASYMERSGAFIAKGLAWGVWQIPEAELNVLGDVSGKDMLELGCGAAEWSRALARLGARPVALDLSGERVAQARAALEAEGLDFPLLQASALAVPYPDASFDFAISEYGACLWADPQRWVPEAARLLRPGGRLVFLTNSFLLTLCMPPEDGVAATERLLRPAFGMYRIDWPGNSGVEFHLSHGDWIRLLRRSGFEVEDLIEVRPAVGAVSRYPFVTVEWARQWPCEEVWKARKTH